MEKGFTNSCHELPFDRACSPLGGVSGRVSRSSGEDSLILDDEKKPDSSTLAESPSVIDQSSSPPGSLGSQMVHSSMSLACPPDSASVISPQVDSSESRLLATQPSISIDSVLYFTDPCSRV